MPVTNIIILIMKKLIVFSLLAVLTISASAKDKFIRFGITGGLTSTQSVADMKANGLDKAALGDFNGGIAFKFKPILGLSIQPSLVYATKTGYMEADHQVKNSYIQLPLQLQYGINIFGVRPYLFAEPYLSYCLGTKITDLSQTVDDIVADSKGLEYGIGAGLGVNLWFFQVAVRYSWGLGSLSNFNWDTVKESLSEKAMELVDTYQTNGVDNMLNGLSVTVAIFF